MLCQLLGENNTFIDIKSMWKILKAINISDIKQV